MPSVMIHKSPSAAMPPLGRARLLLLLFLLPMRIFRTNYFCCCHAFPPNMTSHLNIYIPHSLHKDSPFGLDHVMSTFGHHPKHGSMALPVYYYFLLCESPVDPSKGYPPRGKDAKGIQLRWEPPFVLMSETGGCSYATKARHAQFAGASALILADHACLCSDANCLQNVTWRKDEPCQESYPVSMSDDGSGGDVTIPSFLIYKTDAAPMKEAIVDKGQSVMMSMRWHEPQTVDAINFGLYMDPLDDHSKAILKQIRPIALALGDRANFVPHYLIHDGTRTNCGDADGATEEKDQLCYNVCTNNGRYCYPSFHFNGTAVVVETIRRLCISKHYGNGNVDGDGGARGTPWWEYVTHFDEHCSNDNTTFADEGCIRESMEHAGVKADEIDNCMQDSGDPTEDDSNTLLDQEIAAQKEHGIYMAPTMWVNQRILRPTTTELLDATLIFESICEGYAAGSEPEVCLRCVGSEDAVDCAAKYYEAKSAVVRKHRFWIWSGFLASLGFFGYAHNRYKEFGGGAGGGGSSAGGLSGLQYAMLRDGDDSGFQPPTEL